MKKLWRIVVLVAFAFLATACTSSAASQQDIAERIDSEAYPVITWGVKVDTNLFGKYKIGRAHV